ncbi:hypothetical protein, partial [Senegalimassilia anaerobia]|uniref:hypothetical protein n=1 Tax=Senegalimassilia anaerobia TaxID=1473216 RepID=UPI003AB932FE
TGSNQTLAIVGLIHGNCMQQGLSMFLCPAHIVFASFYCREAARSLAAGYACIIRTVGYAFAISLSGHRRDSAVRAIMGAMKMPQISRRHFHCFAYAQ